jgi:hypothetical protein
MQQAFGYTEATHCMVGERSNRVLQQPVLRLLSVDDGAWLRCTYNALRVAHAGF